MEEKKEKLTYEELEKVASQMNIRIQQLQQQLQQMNYQNVYTRLEFLFKVVENHLQFPDSFVSKCVDEVETLMTIPEQSEEKED